MSSDFVYDMRIIKFIGEMSMKGKKIMSVEVFCLRVC